MSSRYVVSNVPKINRSRSRFDLSHGHKTSGSVGYLYPLDPIEVLPGDTFKFNLSMVARLSSTLVRPVMDNLFIDVHSFFVPKRLLYNKFEEMYGQASPNDWSNPEEIVLPSLDVNSTASDNAIAATQNGGSAQVAQHFGLNGRVAVSYNEGANKKAVSVLPFRAFAMIYNEFFRDENLISPMNVVKGDTGTYEKLNTSAWSPTNYTGCVPKVSKLHDYFTSVLPGIISR